MRVPKSPERSYSIPYPETKAPKLDLCTAQLIRLEAALLVDRALVVSTQEHPLQSSWQGWRGWREWEPEDADMHHDGGETREDPPDNADQAGSGLPCGKGKRCKGKGKAGKCGKGKFTWQGYCSDEEQEQRRQNGAVKTHARMIVISKPHLRNLESQLPCEPRIEVCFCPRRSLGGSGTAGPSGASRKPRNGQPRLRRRLKMGESMWLTVVRQPPDSEL